MRIAYVSADRGIAVPGHSGSSIHVTEMASALVGRGARLTFFGADVGEAGRLPFPCVDLADDEVLEHLRSSVAKSLRSANLDAAQATEAYSLLLNQNLYRKLVEGGPFDLVYERQSLWSLAGLQYARACGIPYFVEVNAPLIEQQAEYRVLASGEVARAIEEVILSHADRVLVTTPALIDHVHARGCPRRNARVLPCGVSERFFAARAKERRRDGFVVGFVGSLKPWHGVDLLLDAFSRLRAISSDYRLLVIGEGPLRADVDAFRRNGLEDCVAVEGGVDHDAVVEYLERMDVAVAPYPPLPGFYFSPLKVWEYAAAGVPIVASASGELPRLFPHKSAALLHEPGKVTKIVEHIERLRREPALAARLARRARRTARLHTWDRIAARVLRAADSVAR